MKSGLPVLALKAQRRRIARIIRLFNLAAVIDAVFK